MRCLPTPIAGLFQVQSDRHRDERGSFQRSWCSESFKAAGIDFVPQQASLSDNARRHTLRGMHYQAAPALEQKLVRCLQGEVFDLVLDLRPGSPTWGQSFATTLSAAQGNAIFIPRGCAHGFLTLVEHTLVEYLIDVPHAPEHARGLRWNDPQFTMAWPCEPAVISARDRSWPDALRDGPAHPADRG